MLGAWKEGRMHAVCKVDALTGGKGRYRCRAIWMVERVVKGRTQVTCKVNGLAWGKGGMMVACKLGD